jgi:hypothetical protein
MPTSRTIQVLSEIHQDLGNIKVKLKALIESIDSSENELNKRDKIVELQREIDKKMYELVSIQRSILSK